MTTRQVLIVATILTLAFVGIMVKQRSGPPQWRDQGGRIDSTEEYWIRRAVREVHDKCRTGLGNDLETLSHVEGVYYSFKVRSYGETQIVTHASWDQGEVTCSGGGREW